MSFAASSAYAQVINFDDLPSDTPTRISNGYAGLNWDNFYVLDGTKYLPGIGYQNGIVSSPNVAFNAYGSPATISNPNGFNLVSGYFNGAWNNGLQITATTANPGVIYSTSFSVNTTGPTYIAFNWNNITSVTFSSAGGTSAGYHGGGKHFALDNLTVTAVSEPEEYGMMLLGFGMVGYQIKRKKKMAALTAA